MKRDLALQLLESLVAGTDEEKVREWFGKLTVLANYKYNLYEMYSPGKLFLENLYVWLAQFDERERAIAIEFVLSQLIFISRTEFQQLSHILYHDFIRRTLIKRAASNAKMDENRIASIIKSEEFIKVSRASLYVGMSDGARIDYLRRQNLAINNEQVVPYYGVGEDKVGELLKELHKSNRTTEGKFQCIFLLDDFCGSGKTLIREVVQVALPAVLPNPEDIPKKWEARLNFKEPTKTQPNGSLEFTFEGTVSSSDLDELRSLVDDEDWRASISAIGEMCEAGTTSLKGSLVKIASSPLGGAIAPDADIYFCPLLITEHAVKRIQPLLKKLSGPFANIEILAGATISESIGIKVGAGPIADICEKYYDESVSDVHTGNVCFGYDRCGLPVVLHHNTPNNSIALLWARTSAKFSPLFVRYERHGRERS